MKNVRVAFISTSKNKTKVKTTQKLRKGTK